MIKRHQTEKLLYLAQRFPVISVTGPRQSGKTTLVRNAFPGKAYVSLEDPDVRSFALDDPRGFLNTYPEAIIDEAQHVPQLFSYIQTAVDSSRIPGRYVLTGSQNFLLLEGITQSLAGRTAVLKLLPFSYSELRETRGTESYESFLYRGFYPVIHSEGLLPGDFFSSYVNTYIERDVRSISNIGDLNRFQMFVRLCAGRVGSLLNFSSLANDCGISHTTASKWLSILEASYVVFLLKPYHGNFNKRLVKTPKLFFYDTGLAAYLLGIQSEKQIETHFARGGLFECMVVSEFMKQAYNQGKEPGCFFWRDKTGNGVDLLLERESGLMPIEIKSGRTPNRDFFMGIDYWRKVSGTEGKGYIIYGGEGIQKGTSDTILSWRNISDI
jgi:predicted AAA+ superfamily ATPase